MITHGNDEKVVASYDSRIVRRLVQFARPHATLIVLSFVALIIATVGEMLIPVLIQRTVDHEILDYRIRVAPAVLDRIPAAEDTVAAGDWVYIREEYADHFTQSERRVLLESRQLDTTRFYLFPRSILDDHPDIQGALADSMVEPEPAGFVVIHATAQELLNTEQRLNVRTDNIQGVRRNSLVFLFVLAGTLIGSFAQVYLTAYTGQLVMKRLRLELFSHTIRQSLSFLGNQAVGRLVTRVTNDVETINEFFSSVLSQLARNVSLMIAVVITMFSLNTRLALIMLLPMIPVIILTDLFRRRARNAYRRVRVAVAGVNAYLSEYISGMPIVQLFVQQARSRHEFFRRGTTLLEAHLTEMRLFAIFRPIVDFMATISTALVIYVGAHLIGAEMVSLGVLIAFTNLIRRFYMPVMNISEQFTVLQSAMAGSERVFALLDEDQAIPDTGLRTVARADVAGTIRFDHVTFAYKVQEPVIRNLSFTVNPGEMVAIVGYTGAGKTTIINLLTRLWDVDTGTITLDGVALGDYSLNSLRQTVQQIQQDVFLFDDTIRNNITLGVAATEEQIWNACERVQIADFIRSLEAGLDTPLQERGANLSAGQRQLLAFARVLIHDPPVLVLDEATSSVDSETERKLQLAVGTVTGGRTSMVIAHRLSTIQHAHRILVMSHGRIVEEGTHSELLARNGLYTTLYQLQFARSRNSPS